MFEPERDVRGGGPSSDAQSDTRPSCSGISATDARGPAGPIASEGEIGSAARLRTYLRGRCTRAAGPISSEGESEFGGRDVEVAGPWCCEPVMADRPRGAGGITLCCLPLTGEHARQSLRRRRLLGRL